MSWYKSKLGSTFLSILGAGGGHGSDAGSGSGAEDPVTLEEIRQAMLALANVDPTERAQKVARRIRYASDVQSLWFIRGEVMGLLARTHGEQAAREEIERVSDMFADLLPQGLRSRPSPLSGNYRGRFGSGD